MRYCVSSKDLSIDEVKDGVLQVGGKNIRELPRLKQIFCDLDLDQASRLSAAGLIVKEIKTIKTAQIAIPTIPAIERVAEAGLNLSALFNEFRAAFTPPLTGTGLTVVVLDSGIRKTHEALKDKVIYEEDFTDSGNCDDGFNHGTNIAYIIAGGVQGSEKSGIAPDAKLINLKTIQDMGMGTDEMLILGIDRACDLVESARNKGLPTYDPEYPNIINISLGAEDDADPDNPVRVACRTAVDEYGLQVVAAAGNAGDKPGTILLPACDEKVVAVGGLYSDIFDVWFNSSRGPTQEGLVKPDFVFWATNIYVASSEADDKYEYKSGTSFSTPIASGLIGPLWELGRRNYGPDWFASWYDIECLGEMFCIKNKQAPIEKDNAWGYGLPALSPLIKGAILPVAPAVDVTSMAVLMMIMMPMIVMAKK